MLRALMPDAAHQKCDSSLTDVTPYSSRASDPSSSHDQRPIVMVAGASSASK